MAEALQHGQAALIARISATCATNNEPVPDAARSGRANAIVSQPRWYKISVRSVTAIAASLAAATLTHNIELFVLTGLLGVFAGVAFVEDFVEFYSRQKTAQPYKRKPKK